MIYRSIFKKPVTNSSDGRAIKEIVCFVGLWVSNEGVRVFIKVLRVLESLRVFERVLQCVFDVFEEIKNVIDYHGYKNLSCIWFLKDFRFIICKH